MSASQDQGWAFSLSLFALQNSDKKSDREQLAPSLFTKRATGSNTLPCSLQKEQLAPLGCELFPRSLQNFALSLFKTSKKSNLLLNIFLKKVEFVETKIFCLILKRVKRVICSSRSFVISTRANRSVALNKKSYRSNSIPRSLQKEQQK